MTIDHQSMMNDKEGVDVLGQMKKNPLFLVTLYLKKTLKYLCLQKVGETSQHFEALPFHIFDYYRYFFVSQAVHFLHGLLS